MSTDLEYAQKPEWAPDGTPENPDGSCYSCNSVFSKQSIITFKKRRHHCRFCGQLVCGDCSKSTMLLPEHFGYLGLPQRVCDNCAERLRPAQARYLETLSNASQTATISNPLLNSPVSMSMVAELNKARCTLKAFMERGALNPDNAVPKKLLQECSGLAFLTVLKAGFLFSGKIGTGLVIAKKANGQWSAPSAIGSTGVGWGAQVGGEIVDFLIIIRNKDAMNSFAGHGSLSLGAGISVAIGPLGRCAEAELRGGDGGVSACYSYSMSRGLFAGISLEGSILVTRSDLNKKFYGQDIEPKRILSSMDPPEASRHFFAQLAEISDTQAPSNFASDMVGSGSGGGGGGEDAAVGGGRSLAGSQSNFGGGAAANFGDNDL